MFCKLKQVLKLILPLKIQKYIKKKILFLKWELKRTGLMTDQAQIVL